MTALSNPFNAPPHIVKALSLADWHDRPLFYHARRLGPKRMQWLGTPQNNGQSPIRQPTCWALDGARASLAEIRAAE